MRVSLKTVQEIKCLFHCCCQEHLHANWEDCLAEKEMYWMAYWEMCTFENWILNWVTSEGSGHKTIFCWVEEFSFFRVCRRFHLNNICSVTSLQNFMEKNFGLAYKLDWLLEHALFFVELAKFSSELDNRFCMLVNSSYIPFLIQKDPILLSYSDKLFQHKSI